MATAGRHQVKQFETTGHPINASQWPHRVCVGPVWLDRVSKNLFVKADLLIYNNCVTVSGQCLGIAIIISNKMNFNSCAYIGWFSQIQSYSYIYMWLDLGKLTMHAQTLKSILLFNIIAMCTNALSRHIDTIAIHRWSSLLLQMVLVKPWKTKTEPVGSLRAINKVTCSAKLLQNLLQLLVWYTVVVSIIVSILY